MAIDLLLIGILAAIGIFGHFSGVVKQLCHWAGLAFGHAASKPLALILTLMLAPELGIPPIEVRVGLSVLCFCTLYVLGTSIANLFLKRLAKKRMKTRFDHAGGFLLALGKGAVMLFVVLSGLAFFEKPLVNAFFRAPPGILQRSAILGLVRRHNLFGTAPLPALARLEQLVKVARDPRAQALQNDPELAALLSDPGLRASLQDERLAKAIKSGDWAALRRDPRIAALLQDPRIVGSLADPLDYEEK